MTGICRSCLSPANTAAVHFALPGCQGLKRQLLLNKNFRQFKAGAPHYMLDDAGKARLTALLNEMHDLAQFEELAELGVNTKGTNDDTPLIVALVREDLQATADLLCAGADPNAVGEDSFSALHWAARSGPGFVRLLLAHGAVPQGRNMFGDTPADTARIRKDYESVTLLDSQVAEPNGPLNSGGR